MSASNSPGGSNKSKGSSTFLKVCLAAVFLLILAGASVWVIRSFVISPDKTVVIPELSAAPAPAAAPTAISAAAAPGAPANAGPPNAAALAAGIDLNAPVIGGTVNNDQGAGIPNVNVRLVWSAQPDGTNTRPPNKTKVVRTDPAGHWTYQGVPREMLTRLNISVTSNDYVALTSRSPPTAQLLDKSFVQTLTKGQTIRGVVVDAQGQPVANVKITGGRNNGRVNAPTATSNTQGQFTLRHIPPGDSVMLMAASPNYAPTALTVKLPAPKDPVQLVMTAGRTITGSVTDKGGKPLAGATIMLNQWQQNYMGGANQARITSDSQGKYTLPNMPVDAIALNAGKPGFSGDFEQVPTGQTTVDFKMSPLITMQGNVTDAVTGKPVDQFTVATGVNWAGSQRTNFSMGGQTFNAGHYQMQLDGYSGSIDAWYMRVQAKGYLPATSPPLLTSGTQDFALQPGKDITGRVLDAAGNPVAGAQMGLAAPGVQLNVNNGDMNNNGPRDQRPLTDAQGKYDFSPQDGNYVIVASAAQGYAQVDQDALAKSPDIKLTPWGSIQGTVIYKGKPAADQQISGYDADRMYDPQAPSVYFNLNANTDQQGHFTMDRVPAGDFGISLLVQMPGTNMFNSAETENVTVTSGQTTTVSIGGKGRPVVGQIIFPAEASTWPAHQTQAYMSSRVTLPPMPMPVEAARNPQAQQKLMSDFRKTDAGKAYFKAQRSTHNYQLILDASGNFRADDVLPGDYTISVNAFPSAGGQMLGSANTQITMPPIPGGYSLDPLEIPAIRMKGTKGIDVGDDAPNFVVKTLDGKDVKLSDYHGKYVLLEFWVAALPQGTTQTDSLKAVYAALGKDPRLVMIGVSGDLLPSITQTYVTKNQLDWVQCIMPRDLTNSIAQDYGLQEIPSIMLIGPDGKLLATHLKGDAIMAAVTKALGATGTQP